MDKKLCIEFNIDELNIILAGLESYLQKPHYHLFKNTGRRKQAT